MSKKEKDERRDEAEWSSDDDYKRSRGSDDGWRSENDWNEESSMAGEDSAMSEETEEERLEKRENLHKNHKKTKPITKKYIRLNLDDVGTDDDGESRHLDDITERTKRRFSKTNVSDMSDMSDIEDQIAEAQHKFEDDKQSLSGVIGLVDEVTTKGENLTRKASETSLVVERDAIKKTVLSNDQISFFDEDEISFRSYTERTSDDDNVPQRDSGGKIPSSHIESRSQENHRKFVKETYAVGRIEYFNPESNDSGSLISEPDQSVHEIRENQADEKTATINCSDTDSHHRSDKHTIMSSKSVDSLLTDVSIKAEAEETGTENKEYQADAEIPLTEEEQEHEQEHEPEEQNPSSPEPKEFEEPECSKYGDKHLCCFINIGGGGDGGRDTAIVERLKKLKDDIANMRKELNLARQECKRESEEVAKLIEAAAERNKAAENELVPANETTALSTYAPQNYCLEEVLPTTTAVSTILPGRAQVAIPASILQNRLQTTRQTASSTYRESLNELERMVEKEMASIKDSMVRLEPLNRIAAEWDAIQPAREPKRTTYTRDYRLEMVTSEMRLQGVKSVIDEIK